MDQSIKQIQGSINAVDDLGQVLEKLENANLFGENELYSISVNEKYFNTSNVLLDNSGVLSDSANR
jgi:hypothetical protein